MIRDRRKVFPVTVNLYTQEEYDALLSKQVQRLCPGCLRYSEEGGSLEGHHREISLAGACYSRMDAREEPSFSACAGLFWDFVAENVNRLAAWTDKGRAEGNQPLSERRTHPFLSAAGVFLRRGGRPLLSLHERVRIHHAELPPGDENAGRYGGPWPRFAHAGDGLEGVSLFSEKDIPPQDPPRLFQTPAPPVCERRGRGKHLPCPLRKECGALERTAAEGAEAHRV